MPAFRRLITAAALGGFVISPLTVLAQDDAGQQARPAPQVEVIKGGEGSKKTLRYKPDEGASYIMKMSTKMSSSQSMNGQVMGEMELPTTTFMARMTADKIEDDEISYTLTFEEVKAEGDDMQAQQVGSMLKTMEGLTGKGVMTTRGYNKSLTFDIPGGAQPMIAQQLESMKTSVGDMSAVLPAEAVGMGAVWTVTTSVEQGGMKMRQTTEYTLDSVEGGVVTLSVKATQTADPQKIENEQIPPGMQLELTAFDGESSGKTSFDLGWLVPKSGKMTGSATVDMKMTSPQGNAEMQQRMQMEMDISGEPAEK